MSAPDTAPTARQLRYLRELAARTATTFAYPATRAQASREIARLRSLPSQRRERAAEQVPGYATAVDVSEEVSGYGSSARWRSGRQAADA